jgi:SAM-dependent methyltransferase
MPPPVDQPLGAYYDRLTRWTRATRFFGPRRAASVHRALADPQAFGRPTTGRLHDVILDHLPPVTSPRVLDAGCGLGGTIHFLAPRLGGSYLGLTLSHGQASAATRLAESLREPVEILVRSYDDPPPGPYDLMVAIESLAHSPDPERTLTALARVAAPDALIVIADDMPRPEASRSPDLARFKSGWQCSELWSAERYRQALSAHGASILVDRDLTPEYQPRSLRRIGRLERLNRALHVMVPSAGWRAVMDSHYGGLALERLYQEGLMKYRLLIARLGAPPRPRAHREGR